MEPTTLRLDGVAKRYRRVQALRDVSLSVSAGTVHGLVGPNGAGKTTVLRVVLGLVRPDAGTVELHPDAGGAEEAPRIAGMLDGAALWPSLSGRRNLEILARLDGASGAAVRARVADVLERLGLGDVADRRLGGWSLGMRTRLGLAAVLLREPRLVLLDEPTNGLDPAGVLQLRGLVAELAAAGVAVVLCSHDMSEVATMCQDVTVLHRGAVAFTGRLQELRERAPDPVYRLTSADDAAAEDVAARLGLDAVRRPSTGLTLTAGQDRVDELVVELGQRRIPVRSLELVTPPLEAAFLELTAGPADGARA